MIIPVSWQRLLYTINNWERFTLEEQIKYIETTINLQSLVASRLDIDMKNEVLQSLIDRLNNIYL